MNCTEETLAKFQVKNGFRLRGESMTRIEVFSDAAFAFAVTMLVISLSAIPKNYLEFVEAMKGIPTFVLSFAMIMGYWLAHRKWSQQFGLEDPISTLLTLSIVVIILIFVYPLKLIMSYTCHFFSGQRLPTEFSISSPADMTGLILAFSSAGLLLALAFMGLYLRAMSERENLKLSSLEILRTREQIAIWSITIGATFISVLLAWLLNPDIGYRGGYALSIPWILIPIIKTRFRKLEKALNTQGTVSATELTQDAID